MPPPSALHPRDHFAQRAGERGFTSVQAESCVRTGWVGTMGIESNALRRDAATTFKDAMSDMNSDKMLERFHTQGKGLRNASP